MSKRFRVAFSFAGEHRKVVGQTAEILARLFGQERILYDRYHEAEFADPDLVFDLPELYAEESDLIVVVICPNYLEKEWCGVEWAAIHACTRRREKARVMLARYSQAEARGLHGSAGYFDLDKKSAQDFAHAIAQRLARQEERPRDFYTQQLVRRAPPAPVKPLEEHTAWPTALPPHDWTLADHSVARKQFELLITGGRRQSILLLTGNSGTGKTHLTNLFWSWIWNVDDVASARLDFKGSLKLEAELANFADHLDIPKPRPGAVVASQLAEMFVALRERGKPTVLIFDTFESAGDAATWILETLLPFIPKVPWLKVIIAGQKTIQLDEMAWRTHCCSPVNLLPPTPQQWHEYESQHDPTITIDFVKELHARCKGHSPWIAQVFRPGGTQ